MADRFCRNCGHELAEGDRFCPNCGRPVHETAHVPTPEADVPVPPSPQGAEETSGQGGTWKWFPLVAFLTLMTIIALSANTGGSGGGGGDGGGGQQAGSGETFTRENYGRLISNPDAHAGAEVDIAGQVFTEPEVGGGETSFQMYADPKDLEWNTLVYAEGENIGVDIDDYVRVKGVVLGGFEGENAFGGTVSGVEVETSNIEPVSGAEAVDPTKKTVEVRQTQTDQGFSVTLKKIEFGEDTTRLYVSAYNGSNALASFYAYDAKIIQGTRQVEEDMSMDYELKEPQSDIEPGVRTDGAVVLGKADPSQPLTVRFEWYSDNFNINAKPIVFEVTPR